MLLSRNSICLGIAHSEVQNERNSAKKCVFLISWVVGNELPKVFFHFGTKSKQFSLCEMVLKGIPSIFIFRGMMGRKLRKVLSLFSSTKRFRMKFRALLLRGMFPKEIKMFRVFSSYTKCLERNSAFFLIFSGMAWNRFPSVFRSSKLAEFQRNESKFPSVPCSVE